MYIAFYLYIIICAPLQVVCTSAARQDNILPAPVTKLADV